MLRTVKVCDGYEYLFTERECEIIEKYFDSIRLFMDDDIVDIIISNIPYETDCYDEVYLLSYYDAYLCENDYEKEHEFSQLMFNEFGVNI